MRKKTPLGKHVSVLAGPLAWLTRWVIRYPRATLGLGIALAVAAVLAATAGMGFRTSRLDLLNPDSGFNKFWLEYIEEFGEEDDVVVVVEGDDRQAVIDALEQLSTDIGRERRLFHAVLHEVDLTKIRAKGLHYLPVKELRRIERFLARAEPAAIRRGHWAELTVAQKLGQLNHVLAAKGGDISPEARKWAHDCLASVAAGLHAALANRPLVDSPWDALGNGVDELKRLDSEYLLAADGRLGFVLLRIKNTDEGFAQGSRAIDKLRWFIGEAKTRYPSLEIGLTGLPVMENDEMRSSQGDMIVAGLLSLAGVACLFIAGLGGLRHPLLTMAALMIGMAWSFGYVTLSVGHLNILSVSFGVVLIGLGIDFGIHYVARYLQQRQTSADCAESLCEAARSVGPGIVTGGLTTAIAFFAAGLTEFTGVAELGVIAGGGIILCIVAAVVLLPAMIFLSDRRRTAGPAPDPLRVERWVAPLLRFPRFSLAATLAATAYLAFHLGHLNYDHNLLNLQPDGLESVALEKKLLSETDQSLWYALSICETPEELRHRTRAFEKLGSVAKTEAIFQWLPGSLAEKGPVIAQIRGYLRVLPETPPEIPAPGVGDIARQLAIAESLLTSTTARDRQTRRDLAAARDGLRRLPPAEAYQRISRYQHFVVGDLLSRLHAMQSMASPEAPRLADLPQSLVNRFVGKSNRYLLKIYGRGDIWDMDQLSQFVTQVKSVDPQATGQPLQTYYASRQMKESYLHAAVYALIAVLIVLFIDFGGMGYALLALAPMILGLIQLFGIMGLADIPLNPANMIVLPLIMGIGIDDGVHVIHDFRRQCGRYRLSSSTATAILITSLTTMVGFGSLMIAGHNGLQSLGRVLTLGVACCLVTSVVLLPALLTWLTRNRAVTDDADDNAGEPDRVARLEMTAPCRAQGDPAAPVAAG